MLGKQESAYTRYMGNHIFDRLWHQKLHRPYYLAKPIDSGRGTTVVFLHGIGRMGQTWQYLIESLQDVPVRAVAFDLLGFGASPKPTWLNYNVDDHAAAVIASIERLKPQAPVIIVGHSMGCLVAVRIAALRPDLVRHLVLYEMPLYKGLPNKRIYRLRLNFYFKIYNWIMRYEPTFDDQSAKLAERLTRRFSGVEVDHTNWQPFVKSLQHTILEQTTPEDIQELSIPMDVIYGSRDMIVIKGTVKHVIGKNTDRLSVHTVRAGHSISRHSSQFLYSRIVAALSPTAPADVM
jgi:pimeloyl-ACP methyl ester carboxylesterase